MSPNPSDAVPGSAGWTTQQSLLDAAESLIAELGVKGTSLRKITSRAGTNLAAANYHFGSKEALVRAVVARHLRPLNAERLQLLDQLEASDLAPRLEEVIHAFVSPVVRYGLERRDKGQDIAKIFGRAMTQPDEVLRGLLIDELKDVIQRFSRAFARALPHLGHRELMWRVHFVVGSMAHTMAGAHMLERITAGLCSLDDREGLVDHLVAFLSAGMRAPATFSGDTDSAPDFNPNRPTAPNHDTEE